MFDFFVSMQDPEGLFPCILGHEAAGYVYYHQQSSFRFLILLGSSQCLRSLFFLGTGLLRVLVKE